MDIHKAGRRTAVTVVAALAAALLDSAPGSLILRNAVSQLRLAERASDGAAVQTLRGTSLRARNA
ncbi:hypothetical protein [Streptomyces sp. NPDC048438]|uniref:hypothetical protein n=1 Tax=Streptomyces sp. NPDC048438 TaxID=3365551 RepID=UPI00371C09A6